MTTINTTSAAGVARKLNNLGFEKFNGEIGFATMTTASGQIHVVNHTYANGHPSTAAEELESNGYVVEGRSSTDWPLLGKSFESFFVIGRVDA
jgi:hypothetical protein